MAADAELGLARQAGNRKMHQFMLPSHRSRKNKGAARMVHPLERPSFKERKQRHGRGDGV
jgi:hypothetical protein